MRKANVTKVMAVVGLALLLVLPLSGACAKPAPAPALAPAPAPAPKPAAAPVPAPKAGPLAEIIAGAKKEGRVVVAISSGYEVAPVVQLITKNIREKYGVELNISATAASGEAPLLARAIMEYQTGATPTYDLITLQDQYAVRGIQAGALEKVDWKPLLEEGTPSGILPADPRLRGSIAYNSLTYGSMYNPQKVPAAEVPKTLADLADPKWKGRLGIFNYAGQWAVLAFVLGKDSTLSHLRSMMKNKALVGLHVDLTNRYMLGEIDLTLTAETFMIMVRKKGVAAEFQSLGFYTQDTYFLMQARARHPNAARLFALYLSSRDGARSITWEQVGRSSVYYPGNYLYDEILPKTRQLGIPVYSRADFPGLLDFVDSPALTEWVKEIELILRGA